jgi:hypothetical protein
MTIDRRHALHRSWAADAYDAIISFDVSAA